VRQSILASTELPKRSLKSDRSSKVGLWQGFPCATGPIQAATVSPKQEQATITHAQSLSPGNFRGRTKWDLDYQLNGVPTATFQRVRGISLLKVTSRTTFPALSDNQRDGVVVMRTYIWVGLAVVLGGLVLWGWWYQHRRAWSTHRQDETMRRHVNKNYD
jgi:hypothetical protein